MAEKKEILDYLRNKQKEAEIESKVNGINLWVLIGAIALVAWQLIDNLTGTRPVNWELTVRSLLCAQGLYLLLEICSPRRGLRDDIRFSRVNGLTGETNLLIFIQGLFIAIPVAYSWFVVGWSVLLVILGLWALAYMVGSLESISSEMFMKSKEVKRFPKPEFSLSAKRNLVIGLGLSVIVISGIAQQLYAMRTQFLVLDVAALKVLALSVALYLLLFSAIDRKQKIHHIDWSYEMETDLVLGSITPEVAIRRIENRALGPRLQDIMDAFFDELDTALLDLDAALQTLSDEIPEINKIPIQYAAERSSRLETALKQPKNQLSFVDSAAKEFSIYVDKLKLKKFDGATNVVGNILIP